MLRTISLLPAATDIIVALGARDCLVGVSHECDAPHIESLPRVTTTPIDVFESGGAIDRQVRALRAAGKAVIGVDAVALAALAPELIVTQDLCEVCAVIDGDVRQIADLIDPQPTLLSLRARTIGGILDDIAAVGAALDRDEDADEVIAGLRYRLERLSSRPPFTRPPRVVCVEWLEPLFLAGHWVPELVEAAGGQDVGARPGDHSTVRRWAEVVELAPDLMVIMLCGFALDRALDEWRRFLAGRTDDARSAAAIDVPVWVLDGNAYTSRPGPRVVDGATRIRAALEGGVSAGLIRVS